MALAELGPAWVPADDFAARLALVRQALGGWNVKRAADLCGIDDQSWRNWEAGKGKPRDYEAVCGKIAAATGVDRRWLQAGGPLRAASPCFWPLPSIEGQMELSLGLEQPALEVASHAA